MISSAAVQILNVESAAIIHKIFERNSGFHVKQREKFNFCFT